MKSFKFFQNMKTVCVDFTPHIKTHRTTPSQHSNTFSDLSCTTLASEISENDEVEKDLPHNRLSPDLEDYGTVGGSEPKNDSHVISISERVSSGVDIEHPETEFDEKKNDDEDLMIPNEMLKTFLGLLILFAGFLCTCISLALTHDRVPSYDPLPDIVLDSISYQKWGLDISEIILSISTSVAVIVVLLHAHRLVILRRIWFILGVLYLYRAITMFVTVLPKSDTGYICKPTSENITALTVFTRVAKIMSGGGLSISGQQVYCGDFIFSGHTATLTLGYLAIKQYSPPSFVLLHWASLLASCSGVIFLLLGRGHYTIDVLLAYWISSRLWYAYHTMANHPQLKEAGGLNLMSQIWWWPILRHFERNIPTSLPAKYNIPFWSIIKKFCLKKKS